MLRSHLPGSVLLILLLTTGSPGHAAHDPTGPGTTDHCDWGGCAEYVAGPGAVVGQLGGTVSLCPAGCSVSNETAPTPAIGVAHVVGMVPTHNALAYTYDTLWGNNAPLAGCMVGPDARCIDGTQTPWVCDQPLLILDSPAATDTIAVSVGTLRVDETLHVCGGSEGTIRADRW